MARQISRLTMLLVAVISVGCIGDRVPVEGKITMDGKPLSGATVTLLGSEGSSHERTFMAETDAQGQYRILTATGKEGVPPGEYSVFVTSVKIPSNVTESTRIPRDPVPPNWRDGSEKFTVPDGGTTEANFVINTRR